MKLLAGIAVLTLGILAMVPAIRATEPPKVDANGKTVGKTFAPDAGASINLQPFRISQNLTLGAVTESSAEAAEADKLAKQLANPNYKIA